MNSLETLQKYGLKTDVKSVIIRIKANEYQYIAQEVCDEHTPQSARLFGISADLRAADLSLLCDLAEKGERRQKPALKPLRVIYSNHGIPWCPAWTNGGETDPRAVIMSLALYNMQLEHYDFNTTEAEGETR